MLCFRCIFLCHRAAVFLILLYIAVLLIFRRAVAGFIVIYKIVLIFANYLNIFPAAARRHINSNQNIKRI